MTVVAEEIKLSSCPFRAGRIRMERDRIFRYMKRNDHDECNIAHCLEGLLDFDVLITGFLVVCMSFFITLIKLESFTGFIVNKRSIHGYRYKIDRVNPLAFEMKLPHL